MRMVNQHIFEEIEKHLLSDDKPSEFLNQISLEPVFSEFPFHMLLRLKSTEQQLEHHPEGNVWNHTVLVINEAAKCRDKSSNPRVFMWAALLHDIGKAVTTRKRKNKITSYDHDIIGADLADEFLSAFGLDRRFIKAVCSLVRWHMQILFVVKDLPFADIRAMKEQTNIDDVALLGLCDRLGRGNVDVKKEEESILIFLSKVKQPY